MASGLCTPPACIGLNESASHAHRLGEYSNVQIQARNLRGKEYHQLAAVKFVALVLQGRRSVGRESHFACQWVRKHPVWSDKRAQ
jgi:hypothetical protein